MKRIIWQTQSSLLFDSFHANELDRRANGGNAYDFQALKVIAKSFYLTLDALALRRDSEDVFRYWLRMRKHVPAGDLIIKEPFPIAFGPSKLAGVQVGIIHHVDFELGRQLPKYRLFLARLFRRLLRLRAVVTVSQFWKKELESLGCKQVKVIYNSFDLKEFNFNGNESEEFRAKHDLPSTKPLIYIGNARKEKGVVEVYQALKDEGYTLVMSGSKNTVDIPVRCLSLERYDYLCLLRACDVVICMSSLLEGWNRVAHEAMLCRTPVIGSGVGGMRELLEGGRQIVLTDFAGLPDAVRTVLSTNRQRGQYGYNYVKQFDINYFTNAWTALLNDLGDELHFTAEA